MDSFGDISCFSFQNPQVQCSAAVNTSYKELLTPAFGLMVPVRFLDNICLYHRFIYSGLAPSVIN